MSEEENMKIRSW